MSGSRVFRKYCLSGTIAAVFVTGCVTNPDGSVSLSDKAKGALIGAAAGCAIASATHKDCAKGAAVGAVAGLLIGWYFESKKVASAQQVNKQYTDPKRKISPPKDAIVPASFSSVVTQNKTASGEKDVEITSNTDLIGYGSKPPAVEQRYAIYDEQDKLVETKTEKIAAVDSAGRYETKSKFKIPKDAEGKKYTVKTELVTDGKSYRQNSYQISFTTRGESRV
jgi:outer membrane protein with glycine zipper